ncbi:MAG: hypoxanthine phosphoribosyltransferase [Trueperaceae bacterium]|nr:hypoxanthine phosphoribosyltransferase [Trueperaceae bacterium]
MPDPANDPTHAPATDTVFTPGAGTVQIAEADLRARVAALGAAIAADHAGEPLHLVCVLNGAFLFMADLVRAIDAPLTVDFLSVSSYGSRTESAGEVQLVKDLDQSLKGKHVVLVEDIVDTGLTMRYLLQYLEGREPLSLKVASLLSKPSRRTVDVHVDYLGFEIDDAFVYGYGLDVAHAYRNLPFVTSMTREEAEAAGE